MTHDDFSQPLPEAGWYLDPVNENYERYWNGSLWTSAVRQNTKSPQGRSSLSTAESPMATSIYRYRQEVTAQEDAPIASWSRRLLAYLIDALVIFMILLPIGMMILSPHQLGAEQWVNDMAAATRSGSLTIPDMWDPRYGLDKAAEQMTIAMVVIKFVYTALFTRYRQATPGQRICGLVITPASGALTWPRTFMRQLIFVIADSLIYLAVLNALVIIMHPKRQGIHDLLAQTTVQMKRS